MAHCPICNDYDRMEKVTTIYQSGTSIGHYTGSGYGVGSVAGRLAVTSQTMHISGEQRTLLSQKLSPPLAPWEVHRRRSPGTVFIVLGFAPGLYACVLTLFLAEQSPGTVPLVWGGFLVFLLTMVMIGAILNSRAERKRRRVIAEETPRWQEAIRNWEQLYYCHRDNVVFHPASPQRNVPADQMFSLI